MNALIAAGYLIYGCRAHAMGRKGAQRPPYYALRFACMLLCPVVGAVYLGFGSLLRRVFSRRGDELEAVEFSKERVSQRAIADEKEERELLPIQEALLVSTPEELRRLMLTVLKRDDLIHLHTVALAVRSEDSETAHYAGSLLSKAVNAFRSSIQAEARALMDAEGEGEENNPKRHDLAVQLVKDMNFLLQQHLLPGIEQELMTRDMVRAGELAYGIEKEGGGENAALALDAPEYSGLAMRLMDISAYDEASVWCGRAMENCPGRAESYKCLLRLRYETGDRHGFLAAIARLMGTDIPIDGELMDMIRLFGAE